MDYLQNEFMERAVSLSKSRMESNEGGPFGAVVVRDGKIIGEGWNMVTSANDPTAHAEVTAIRRSCAAIGNFSLAGCEIYTSCEPCPMCLAAIYWARLDKIYYGNTRQQAAEIGFDDNFLYEEIPKPLEQRDIPMVRLLPEKAMEVFKLWMMKPDKKPY